MTDDFPVLSAGPTPRTPLAAWTFEIRGAVGHPVSSTGFWEMYGYHNYGDPWKEQRYTGD